MEKVFFKLLVEDDYPPVSSESLWAERLDSGSFIVKNIPFYTREVCLDDEISVSLGVNAEYHFKKVIKNTGNSTLRIIFFEAGEPWISSVLEDLVASGCAWEGMSKKFFSINVPADVSLDDVLSVLAEKEAKGWLDYESGMLRQ